MQWKNIGPRLTEIRDLIDEDVAKDTRKLMSFEEFQDAADISETTESSHGIRAFCEKRAAYLLNYEKIKNLPQDKQD